MSGSESSSNTAPGWARAALVDLPARGPRSRVLAALAVPEAVPLSEAESSDSSPAREGWLEVLPRGRGGRRPGNRGRGGRQPGAGRPRGGRRQEHHATTLGTGGPPVGRARAETNAGKSASGPVGAEALPGTIAYARKALEEKRAKQRSTASNSTHVVASQLALLPVSTLATSAASFGQEIQALAVQLASGSSAGHPTKLGKFCKFTMQAPSWATTSTKALALQTGVCQQHVTSYVSAYASSCVQHAHKNWEDASTIVAAKRDDGWQHLKTKWNLRSDETPGRLKHPHHKNAETLKVLQVELIKSHLVYHPVTGEYAAFRTVLPTTLMPLEKCNTVCLTEAILRQVDLNDEKLTAIPSRNVAHVSGRATAASTGSGRVHVFRV